MTIRIPKQINKNIVLLFMMFLYPAISNYIWRIVSIIIPISMNVFDFVVWVAVIVWCFPFITKRITSRSVLLYLVLVVTVLLFFTITSYSAFDFSTFLRLVFTIFPALFIGVCLNIDETIYESMYKISVFVLIVSIAYSFYFMIDRTLLTDNMYFAYTVLPAVFFIASGIFTREKKTMNIILTVVSSVFLLALGTRGPILCLVAFIAIMLFKKVGFTKFSSLVLVGGMVIYFFVSSPFYTATLLKLSNILENAGFSTRIVEMVLEDNLADGNGRDAIQDKLINDIKESPLSIRGPYSDRAALKGLVDNAYGVVHSDGGFAHNIILELIYDFGIIFGLVIVVWLIYKMIRLVVESEQKHMYIVTTAVCIGFVHLLVSGSYLDETKFFFLIGLFLNNTFRLNSKNYKYGDRDHNVGYNKAI